MLFAIWLLRNRHFLVFAISWMSALIWVMYRKRHEYHFYYFYDNNSQQYYFLNFKYHIINVIHHELHTSALGHADNLSKWNVRKLDHLRGLRRGTMLLGVLVLR